MIFNSFDGKKIFVHEWLDVENPKGVVQIVHGMAEHGGRYQPFAQYLNEHDYLVFADDHRGHGYTDPDTLGYAEGDMFRDTVRDEAELTDYYRKKYPGLKYFIFGFSYGSFLTQSYISQYADKVDAAVIGGSSHKKDAEVYFGSLVAKMGKAKAPAKLIENLSFGAYAKQFSDGAWLSNDAESNARYYADRFCAFTCSRKFYSNFFRGLRSLYTKKYIAGLKKDLPVLLISGAEDPVGNKSKGVKKLDAFYRKAGMKNVELVLFPGSRHEFLNEREGQQERREVMLSFFEKYAAGEKEEVHG